MGITNAAGSSHFLADVLGYDHSRKRSVIFSPELWIDVNVIKHGVNRESDEIVGPKIDPSVCGMILNNPIIGHLPGRSA